MKLKKVMELPLKYSHHIGEMQKNFTQKKFHQKKKKFPNVKKKQHFLKKQLTRKKFFLKIIGLKNSKNIGHQVKIKHIES